VVWRLPYFDCISSAASAAKSAPVSVVGSIWSEGRVHDGRQVQARELAGQRLQRVLVRQVVDVQTRAPEHRDLRRDRLALLLATLLEGLQGAGDAHHHSNAVSAFSACSTIGKAGCSSMKCRYSAIGLFLGPTPADPFRHRRQAEDGLRVVQHLRQCRGRCDTALSMHLKPIRTRLRPM
jgi:hypothetical protein